VRFIKISGLIALAAALAMTGCSTAVASPNTVTSAHCHYRWIGKYPLPDATCTPGATYAVVTQADIRTTICRSGWTATVRPPVAVTEPEKLASAKSYGYTGRLSTAEFDHLIPLELGGAPNTLTNLWIEPNDRSGAKTTSNTKDLVENAANRAVCSGRMTLKTAQRAMAANWVTLGRQLGVLH
jgi:hypothetical protein